MAVDCYYNYNENEHEVKEEEEDYIDMEVTSFTHFFSKNTTLPSPQHPAEFEFHMTTMKVERDSTTSPADELFYKGKLLPLHLPPRLQMVEKLLQDSTPSSHLNKFNEFYSTPLGTNTANTPTTSTPFESCNISPVESCQVSRELNREEYFAHYANEDEQKELITNNAKKSWTKKLKTRIKSFFGKSGYSDESSAASATKSKDGGLSLKGRDDNLEKQVKETKKIPFGQIPSVVSREIFGRENEAKEGNICHRRSFSGAFKRRSSTTKLSSSSSGSSSSSSSASSNSNGLNDLQLLKRSSSSNSEIETSLIQGAISHCKKSQQPIRSRKTLSEIGCHSFPSRFVAFDDQTSVTGLCRG